ncbi:MAG TPA: WD40 repeat domain-containing protein, partial [Pyrinomonadaceae bacterium]|nr:WD40 repeat domain-containing protein [Pyrinomonadaceae bacterium]
MRFFTRCSLLSLTLVFLPLASTAAASEPAVWTTNSRAEMLKGEARGVSVTDTGGLQLAPQFKQIYNTEQAYIWSSAIDNANNVFLGTGHDGRIYRVGADGRGALFVDTAELDVTALAIGRDGALYAGTSPDGKVYRIDQTGRAEVYFDPPDKYIWSLAMMADGALAIGTGDAGKIYRVRAANEKAENSLLIDIDETHVISLAADGRGQLIAGTDPGGLVLRVSPEGKAFALFDAPLREIHALSFGADGSIYALALSDGASVSRFPPPAGALPAPGGGGGSVSVSVTPLVVDDGSGANLSPGGGPATPARSRNDLASARSAVFRITPDGGTDTLWSSNTITAFSLAAQGEQVLIGTSDKGRIYSVAADGRDKLLVQSSEDQISVLHARANEVFAASSNQGKLFRLTGDATNEGTYESIVKDVRFVASWGRVWWRGAGNVELQTRSGNTERPDATWSEWSAPYRDPRGGQVTSPRARFIQWRALLRAGTTANGGTAASAANVEDVNLAYLPRNVAPEVLSISALPAGVGLQQALQAQIDPNVESSGLNPALFGAVAQVPPRRLYQRGAVSLQWQAEDRNNDTLEYKVYYRSLRETDDHLLKDHLSDNFYTVDGAAL